MPAKKSSLTATEVVAAVAEGSGLTKAQAKQALDVLQELIIKQVKQGGEIKLFKLVKIAVKHKPATKSREGRNPATGQMITIAAKPARKVVKASALKLLKDAV
jgi:nucleoid DNA-binding protein